MILFGTINIYEEYTYQTFKILTKLLIFADYSKSILPQSASFSHDGTHMLTLETYISKRLFIKTLHELRQDNKRRNVLSINIYKYAWDCY